MNRIFMLHAFLLCFAGFSYGVRLISPKKEWCVATVSAPDDKLQTFLDTACSQLDCSAINPGGECFEPNTLRNHASYALDLFFRTYASCNSEIGTKATTDPSFGSCHYP